VKVIIEVILVKINISSIKLRTPNIIVYCLCEKPVYLYGLSMESTHREYFRYNGIVLCAIRTILSAMEPQIGDEMA